MKKVRAGSPRNGKLQADGEQKSVCTAFHGSLLGGLRLVRAHVYSPR